jgi:RsiW-degrading membrane proteinase PrsW (M82 family)
MEGIGALFLLIFMAALPVMAAFVWLRLRKYPFGIVWFTGAILTGALALVAAASAQTLFPPLPPLSGLAGVLFKVFIQIAGTEELSRLLTLTAFFKLASHIGPFRTGGGGYSHSLVSGLVAGLGFAFIETISYAAADFRIALFRVFSAAPLHAACGIRSAFAADFIVRGRDDNKTGGGRNFVFALVIHGMYNFFLINPGVPAPIPLLLALISLITPLVSLRRKARDAS